MNALRRFAGTRTVITGAASGIGRASAEAFAREGARLALVDRDAAALESLSHALQGQGAEVLAFVADVSSASAGWSSGGIATAVSQQDWQRTFQINVEGTWLWARAVIPPMQRARKGSIITLSSQLALAGARNNTAYAASKGAVMAMTRTMALDYVDDGIRINSVAPGATDTPLLRRAFARSADPGAARARLAARHAMGRLGTAEEIAAAVLFLASDEASFITGTVLPVEGGWLAA